MRNTMLNLLDKVTPADEGTAVGLLFLIFLLISGAASAANGYIHREEIAGCEVACAPHPSSYTGGACVCDVTKEIRN